MAALPGLTHGQHAYVCGVSWPSRACAPSAILPSHSLIRRAVYLQVVLQDMYLVLCEGFPFYKRRFYSFRLLHAENLVVDLRVSVSSSLSLGQPVEAC
eukprot:1378391-Pleurochrysis_carterae.AAC.1